MSINVSVNSNILSLLAGIAASSLFGSTNIRVLSETVGKAGEVSKLVRQAEKEGLVVTADTVYTRSFKRGNRNITEEIPTKSVTLTDAGRNLNNLVTALNSGDDATAANIMRGLLASSTEAEASAVEKPAKAPRKPKTEKVAKAAKVGK